MKKILLPTDFSENSWNAIKYALTLFKDEICSFTLLNTYTPVIYQFEYMQLSSAQLQIMDAVKDTSEKNLQNLVNKIKAEFNNPNHSFTYVSSFNNLNAEIDELCLGNVMDLIVMGTKGATGLKEVLFGSNTVHVLKKAKCPVLAIPSDFYFESPHEILFPSDYGIDFKKKQLQLLLDLAEMNHARVNFLHVYQNGELSANQEKNRKKLEDWFEHVAHLFHNVQHQNISEAIANFQMKSKINLLVMINNKHSFFENLFFKSNIKHLGFHLNVPFLVIPSSSYLYN